MSTPSESRQAVEAPPAPPDCFAAHMAELPTPGSRVFDARDALAAALIHNNANPDMRKELENLREDLRTLSEQNQNLHAYSQLIYEIANKLRKDVVSLLDENAKATIEMQKLRENEEIHARSTRLKLLEETTALMTVTAERDSYKSQLDVLKSQIQTDDAPNQDCLDHNARDSAPPQPSRRAASSKGATSQGLQVAGTPGDRLATKRLRNTLAARRHHERKAQAALENITKTADKL